MSISVELLNKLWVLDRLRNFYGKNESNDFCDNEIIAPNEFYQYAAIPSLVFVIILAFMTIRENADSESCCYGRPGLPLPMDFLSQKKNRLMYLFSFCIVAYITFNIIESKGSFAFTEGVDYQPWHKTFFRLLAVFVYGVVFYPLLSCIWHDTVLSLCLGTMYILGFFIANLYSIIACLSHAQLDRSSVTTIVFESLPLYTCCLALCLALPIRAVQKLFKGEIMWSQNTNKMDNIRASESYLKHLLTFARTTKVEDLGTMQKFKHSLGLHSFRHPGLRFPTFFLCSLICCVVLIYIVAYKICVLFVSMETQLAHSCSVLTKGDDRSIDDVVKNIKENVKKMKDGFKDYFIENAIRLPVLIILDGCGMVNYLMWVAKVVTITAVVLVLLLNFIHIPFVLLNYKYNMIDICKGQYTQVNRINEVGPNDTLFLGYSRLCGYMIAYMFWGMFIQFAVIILLVFGIVFGFILPIRFGFGKIFLDLLKDNWPVVLSSIVMYFSQRYITRFCFIQESGKVFGLKNRAAYYIWVYFMLFYNVFLGIFGLLIRIGKLAGFVIVFLTRMDHSILPKKFEYCDPGWICYQSYLHVQHLHSNPLSLLFITSLLEASELSKKGMSKKVKGVEIEVSDEQKMKYKRHRAVAFQWSVFYTLVNNPSLLVYRKHHMDSRAERIRKRKELAEVILERELSKPGKMFLESVKDRIRTIRSSNTSTTDETQQEDTVV